MGTQAPPSTPHPHPPSYPLRAQGTGKTTHSMSFLERGFSVYFANWHLGTGHDAPQRPGKPKAPSPHLSPPPQAANTCLEGRSLSKQLSPSSKGCCLEAQVPNCQVLITNRALSPQITQDHSTQRSSTYRVHQTLHSRPPRAQHRGSGKNSRSSPARLICIL